MGYWVSANPSIGNQLNGRRLQLEDDEAFW